MKEMGISLWNGGLALELRRDIWNSHPWNSPGQNKR